jgi:hypothetical protein
MSKIKYPIYIISKGRWDTRLTSKSLELMKVPYSIVVEPSEYENYAKYIDAKKIIVLPSNLSELGQGSIPVRNYVWDHSVSLGYKRHWLLDDNINGFERLNKNTRGRIKCDSIFLAVEDFVDRYENIALAGFEYRQFGGGARRPKPPYKLNHRVYSTTLIKNDIPYRWRGKYNEDTDLCLRVLKDGWVTLTFNCFLQNKMTTMSMKGGNTDSIYAEDNERREFAESLFRQHPDCVKVVKRYNRWHHEVDYSKFEENALILKKNINLNEYPKVNEFGMKKVIIK